MDFDAHSIAESCVIAPQDSCVDVADFFGKECRFFHGVEQRILLPSSEADFAAFEADPRLLLSIDQWCRLFRYSSPEGQNFDLVASICSGDVLRFDLISFARPDPKKGRRAPVVFLQARSLDREQLTEWLIGHAERHFLNRDPRNLVMQRPPVVAKPLPRLAWVGSPVLQGTDIRFKADAIGRVLGAEILHLSPRSFHGTMADLKGLLPLDGVYLDVSIAAKFGEAVVPTQVKRESIYTGLTAAALDVAGELRLASEIVAEEARSLRLAGIAEGDLILCAMVRPMLAHAKIGQFNHCSRETVLTTVRAKKLNVRLAEELLDANSEQYADTIQSDHIFLWKAHNDGDQYFLNPRRVGDCQALVQRVA